MCEAKRHCRQCSTMEGQNHEYNKRYCLQGLKYRVIGHKCYISPLSDRAPRSDRVLFLFYNVETTHNAKCTDTSFKHVPNLLCVQKFSAVCEDDADMDVKYQRCGKKKHSFWTDRFGDLISYAFNP